MTARLQSKIDLLNKKLTQLREQKQRTEARERAKAANQKRSTETRQKVLIGAFVLQHLSADKLRQFRLADQSLDLWLTRPADRALFGLAPCELDE